MSTETSDASNPLRWRRVRALFDELIQLPVERREPVLLAACGDDAALADEVRSLLGADGGSDGDTASPNTLSLARAAPNLLDQLGASIQTRTADAWVGTRLGAWQLKMQIGRGGMGAVYLAERADGAYDQQAAVKLVRSDWDSDELLRRFHTERQILAHLNHPNIARLLDGGRSDDGKPYLVLEYVAGRNLIEHCDRARLDLAQRLALILTVCDAVEHAHRNLVVHRDLKPSNILVSEDGQVKLLDFGIAKVLDTTDGVTATAARAFTPDYAAPEQVRGEPVTTSVDVYALGLVLYELLSGQRPFASRASSPADHEHAILTEEPMPPSRTPRSSEAESATHAADARRSDPATLRSHLRGDLDAIVLKALRKDPRQRYTSVSALAEDLKRYLGRQPVYARQGRLRYRLARFVQRHAVATGLSAIVVLALAGGLALALWQAEHTRQQRDVARIEADKATAIADFLSELFEGANPELTDGTEPSARDLMERAVERIETSAGLDPAARAGLQGTMGRAFQGLGAHDRAQPLLAAALAEAERVHDYPLQARLLVNLAAHHAYIGEFEHALELSQRQIALLDRHRVDDPGLRRDGQAYLGLALSNLSRFEEAVELLLPVYEQLMVEGQVVSAEMAGMLTTLTAALARLTRFDEAVRVSEPSYLAALADSKLPLVRSTLFINAYGVALSQAREYERVLPVWHEYLTRMRALYGEEDFRTSTAHYNLALTLADLQRNAEAITEIDRALAIRRRLLAPDHDRLAAVLQSAAGIHADGGGLDTGLTLVEESLAILRAKGAAESMLGVHALYRKARIHEQRGEALLALETIERVLPFVGGSPDFYPGAMAAIPLLLNARVLHGMGRLAEDCTPLERMREIPGMPFERGLEIRILAAACAFEAGERSHAEALLAEVPDPLPERFITDYSRALLPTLRAAL